MRKVVTPRATSASGTPIGITVRRPASSSSGAVTRPRLSPANVRVIVARIATPAGAPPSADIPEGMSRATTERPLALISSVARATAWRAEGGEHGDDRVGGAVTGVLHEHGAGNAELGDRPSIEPPHLLGGEDAQHRYFPAGSGAAWTRKSARIAV